MIPKAEPKATPELLRHIPEERIPCKFFPPGCEQRSRRGETSLVTKTRLSLGSPWGIPVGNALYGEGEVIADAALCREKG